MKSLDHHALRAKLAARAELVATARDLGNQLRGFLRSFGLVVGKGKGRFEPRVLALVASCPVLEPVADALLAARRAVLAEVERQDRVLLREARQDLTCRRLMMVPGVGPITALAYQSTIEEPMRFGRARDVGAYLGLVPRRHQRPREHYSRRCVRKFHLEEHVFSEPLLEVADREFNQIMTNTIKVIYARS